MLNLTFVRSFVAVAETGSFQLAAEQLQLAQPTISQHLKRLEDSLGMQLVERSRASASLPTKAGVQVLPLARSLLTTAERMRRLGVDEPLKIGASANIANYYLAQGLRDLETSLGGHQGWEVLQARNVQLVEQLRAGTLDAAFTEWPPNADDLTSQPWLSDTLVIIVPADHPLSARRRIAWDEAAALPMLAGEPGTGTATVLREVLGARMEDLNLTRTLGSTEAVKRAVAEGLGCSIVLNGAVTHEVRQGLIAALDVADVALKKTFYLSHLPGAERGSAIAGLRTCFGLENASVP